MSIFTVAALSVSRVNRVLHSTLVLNVLSWNCVGFLMQSEGERIILFPMFRILLVCSGILQTCVSN